MCSCSYGRRSDGLSVYFSSVTVSPKILYSCLQLRCAGRGLTEVHCV